MSVTGSSSGVGWGGGGGGILYSEKSETKLSANILK